MPLVAAHSAGGADSRTLDQHWRVALDPGDRGTGDGWFARVLQDMVELPGSLEQAGIGNRPSVDTPWTGDLNDKSFFTSPDYARYRDPAAFKFPYFLQPSHWYRGAAWYQREIDIPADWDGKSIELFLERAHWETRVWIDGRSFGANQALHVPHRYRLGALAPGRHRLTIRVDNRMIVEIGHNGHGVTDHTQGNWNGITGRIELRADGPHWFEGVELHPDLPNRTLVVRGRVAAIGKGRRAQMVQLEAGGRTSQAALDWAEDGAAFDARLAFDAGEAEALRPWSEFTPVLHRATLSLGDGTRWEGLYGWRDLRGGPEGFTLNGRPLMLRGTLECAIWPLTGHPPTTRPEWDRLMQRVRDYGLNHLRFHSYCPPAAAFEAADAAGIYLQIETVWANQSVAIGQGQPVDRWVYDETERVLAEHGNHPSFLLMSHGNEPGEGSGGKPAEARRDAFLAGYVRHFRARDPRRFWTAGTGWPLLPESQYHVTPTPRIQDWGAGLHSRINGKPPETQTDYRDFIARYAAPVVSHEIGEWCVYPNLDERPKYSGYLKPKNFDIFEDRLRANGLLPLASAFVRSSGKLQVQCYKEDIESALRTPGMGGFQLLGVQDFPGQGTALVGIADPFWDEKAYVTAAAFRRFCAPTVPLVRMASRIARAGADFAFTIDIAHFGATALDEAEIGWTIRTEEGAMLAEGRFPGRRIPIGNAPLDLAVKCPLSAPRATAARLEVTVRQGARQIAANDWDIWIYPARPTPSLRAVDRLRHASGFDAETLRHLEEGGDALIGLHPKTIANYAETPVKLGFSSLFWNTAWTGRQPPTTLGLLCDPEHPALAHFPTEAHSNWQWWYLIHRAGALRLDLLPPGLSPIVRIIDDWVTARPLALMIEAQLGRGRAIVCGFSTRAEDCADPVSQQMIASLSAYMQGGAFAPRTRVTSEQLRRLTVAG
ncbi:sugar-binding domain-containing protein [Sphingomonas morindae]|uniref:Glycoside hydrolase n=1 Tax=Sphingomonas morindae TaxID=1541170 RepID=A0ABY4XC61_9SPHN|nr:sugar-binding domain-containing protein [Sphingomonas morindae]USI74475.1 hypothetical protein LHA26_03135 [Sphingomonas morindae]